VPAATPTKTTVGTRRLAGHARRLQIVTTAKTLFAERGYRATTMDDIALAAGVTKPLVYQHFSSKRDLYQELVDSVAQELLDALNYAMGEASGPRQLVELGFATYFELAVTHEEAFRLLFGRDVPKDEELNEAVLRIEDTLARAVEELLDAGLSPDHRRLLAHAVVGMTEGASRHWVATASSRQHDGDDGTDPSAAARLLARRVSDLAWAGLRSVHAD
jgi:AcrR family transcriptional regulator